MEVEKFIYFLQDIDRCNFRFFSLVVRVVFSLNASLLRKKRRRWWCVHYGICAAASRRRRTTRFHFFCIQTRRRKESKDVDMHIKHSKGKRHVREVLRKWKGEIRWLHPGGVHEVAHRRNWSFMKVKFAHTIAPLHLCVSNRLSCSKKHDSISNLEHE